jgi:hypothetical protein
MVKRRDPPGEVERMLLQHRMGERKTQVLGHGGHRRDQQRRVIDRDLQALQDGDVAAAR